MQAGGDTKLFRELEANIRVHKYIGETNRSTFERGWEHQSDYTNLSTKSHMLKHAVEMHPEEGLDKIEFGMKVIRYTKSAFERQILESVEIQSSRNHHLLNSRSEFNRCAIPRMMCKMGDKSFKKNEEDIEQDLAREEQQVSKIRDLVKERNKIRAETSRIHGAAPGPKRRKTGMDSYEIEQERKTEKLEMQDSEKRKEREENPPLSPQKKKRKISQNIKEIILKMHANEKIRQEEQQESQDRDARARTRSEDAEQKEDKPLEVGSSVDTTPPEVPVMSKESRHVQFEIINWEEIFHKHLEENREIERARQEKIEKKEKKEQSWQLLRECRNFLRENEKTWKFIENEKPKLKKKAEEKNKRLTLAKIQKEETMKRIKQTKISSAWKKLPEIEKKRFLEEEEKTKRLDLQEMKSNIWKKYRRKETNRKIAEDPQIGQEELDKKLEKIEETIEKLRAEEKKRLENR